MRLFSKTRNYFNKQEFIKFFNRNLKSTIKLSSNLLLGYLIYSFFNKNNKLNFHSHLNCFSTTINDISYSYYPANNPIEDRYEIRFLKNIKNALFLSVLDGHGGFTLSEFANQRLAKYIDEMLPNTLKTSKSEQEAIVSCLKNTFARVEKEFYDQAKGLYGKGNGKEACLGSCALVAIIYNDYLYIANLGDSKARLIRYDTKYKEYYTEKLMHRHNSEKPREMSKLKEMFPNEKDIVICKRPNNTVCYVKGRLQPTRSFGDFHLKYKEFNEREGRNFKSMIKDFNGPYISAIPEITVYKIDYEVDKFLVMASDGLGDYVTSKEVIELVTGKIKDNKEPKADDLLGKCLNNAAKEANFTLSQLKTLPLGTRRNYHDDTTIIFLPLKK